MGKYAFDFAENSPYSAALHLLADVDLRGKVVLDIGCGAAPMAEPLSKRGADYVGLDLDHDAITKLIGLGFEGHLIDLDAPELALQVDEIMGARPVAAILCLDVLEHTADPDVVLAGLTEATARHPAVELVVSMPNIGHADIVWQLLCGRWQMTETGLMDRTHLRFFTEQSLGELMSGAGWFEASRADFRLEQSDQHISGHPLFERDTVIGTLLHGIRDGADDYATVNQFVRRYHRGAPRLPRARAQSQPFLSVITRTSGDRPETLEDVLCCLAAQTDLDFEVILVVHHPAKLADVTAQVNRFEGNLSQRVRLLPCPGGSRGQAANVGLKAAAGDYVTYLDDDDLVTADWVATIKAGAAAAPGRVIRSWAAEQTRHRAAPGAGGFIEATGPLRPVYTTKFNLVRHIRQNETPFHCFAFPRSLSHMGYFFDETLTVCEDWHFLLRVAALCGVHDTEQVTGIYNRWEKDSSAQAVSAEEWNTMRSYIHVALDEQPLLLPPGSVRLLDTLAAEREEEARELKRRHNRIAELERALTETEAELAAHARALHDTNGALEEIRSSTSWRVSKPVRTVGAMLNRLRLGRRRER